MTASVPASSRKLLYVINEDFAFLMNRLPMARAARNAGFQVHVATRVDKGAEAIEAEGFILHKIPFRRGGLSPFAALPTISALRRVERRIKPSLIHHSGLQCCVYGSIAAFGRKTPLINAITGLGYVFTSVNWRTYLLKRGLAALLPRLLNQRRSQVLVQNPDDRDALEVLGVLPERIVLVPGSGVDTEVLHPLPEPEGVFTIGFAGRLLTDKGIRALVAAHDILRSRGINVNLLIAGNPDHANPASVSIEEATEWGSRPGITWLGHIKDIVFLWRRCHVAVLPSHREGLPMALLEAAACGRPMIATDAPGCREIVIHDETGIQVPIENPEALANAIAKLANSPELRMRYGQTARRLVESKLSAKLVGEAIVELYEGLQHSIQGGSTIPNTLPSGILKRGRPRPNRILVVSQHYAPFSSTTAGYMTDIATGLAIDNDVVVLSGTPSSSSSTPRQHGKPHILEISSWWPGKSALVSRSIAAVLFAIQVFFAVLRHSRRGDAVICVTTPFTCPYAVTLATRLRGASAAVIIYDFYPDTLVMVGLLSPSSILTKLLRWANGIMFNWLKGIVVIGRDMRHIVLDYPGVAESKIAFIPNWPTLPVGYRELRPENPFRARCPGKFIVAMSGTAGFTHDPDSVFESARILSGKTNIHFLVSGEGVGWIKLKEMQEANPLSNITLIERVPDQQLEDLLSAADVWIIPYRKNNTGVSVPSRIYNLLAIGRPVILCSEPDAEAAILVMENNIGWVVEPENPSALAQTISIAASDSFQTAEMGRRATKVAPQYSREIALASYRQVMSNILQDN